MPRPRQWPREPPALKSRLDKVRPTCHYCGESCVWSATSSHIYHGADYGAVWGCPDCDAYVGCHKNGSTPHVHTKGTPANGKDRELRKQAHAKFDMMWKRVATRDNISQSEARKRGYAWLAAEMDLAPEDCHIGMLHGDDLLDVIECCTFPFGLRDAE